MANRDLLKEAIADAKALKETAIANAKAALEEAFEPKLKSMLSAKLEEMEKEELEEAEEEMTEAKKKYKDDDRKDGGESKETKRTEKMKYGKDLAEAEDIDEEMDLDEILAELEEGDDLSEDARTDAEEEGYKDGMEDEKEDMEDDEEDEEIDLEEMTEDDLKSFIEDVIADMVESGELEAGDEFESEDDDEEIDVEDDTEVDVEVNEAKEDMDEGYGKDDMDEGLDEEVKEKKEEMDEVTLNEEPVSAMAIAAGMASILGGSAALAALQTAAEDGKLGAKGKKVFDFLQKISKGSTAATQNLEEKDEVEEGSYDDMMEEVNQLKAELHEVNLLNAKLLYTNKIFRAKNLKEAQKVKVLEAFDKASNVKEVKLIFETLSEGMVAKTATPIKENLGRASKAAGVAPTKQPIVEVDSQVARWQKLAGLR